MDRRVFAGLAAVAAMALTPNLGHAQGAGRSTGAGLTVPVAGLVNGTSPVTGTFKINRFDLINNEVRAIGTLSLNHGGKVIVAATSWKLLLPTNKAASFISEQNAMAAAATPAATCEILSLTLGPLHLDLLGLVIDLNQVQLDIVAESGSGNLLGNLLCAVANLLNGVNLGSLLQQLVNALNALIAAL